MNNIDLDLIEHKISSEKVFSGKLLHVYKDEVELPSKKIATREYIKHPGAAAVLPILDNGNVILVKQFRYPINKVTLEIPAGKLDKKGEDPLICAKRELSEETGYSAKKYKKIHTLATTVGFSDEWIHIYLAENLIKGEKHPDEDEFINVVEMPISAAIDLIYNGEICDGKSVIALLMAKDYLKDGKN